MGDQNKVIAGVILAVVAVVLIVVALSGDPGGGNGDGETGESSGGVDLGCALRGASAGALADGLSKGKSAGAIALGLGAGAAAAAGCQQAIKLLRDQPEEPVDLTVDGQQQQTTGSELAQTPPRPTSDLGRAIACYRWGSQALYKWCLAGGIGPPSATYRPSG